jgi:hypothetical protein
MGSKYHPLIWGGSSPELRREEMAPEREICIVVVADGI